MEQANSEERRKYIRLDVEAKVNFRIKEKKEGESAPVSVSGVSKNISIEGVCFRTEQELASGTELELEVFLPAESEPLLLRGEVKWSRPIRSKEKAKVMFDTGVQLVTLEPSDENRYLRYVSERMMQRLRRHFHV